MTLSIATPLPEGSGVRASLPEDLMGMGPGLQLTGEPDNLRALLEHLLYTLEEATK